jgi:hypothetical protein
MIRERQMSGRSKDKGLLPPFENSSGQAGRKKPQRIPQKDQDGRDGKNGPFQGTVPVVDGSQDRFLPSSFPVAKGTALLIDRTLLAMSGLTLMTVRAMGPFKSPAEILLFMELDPEGRKP